MESLGINLGPGRLALVTFMSSEPARFCVPPIISDPLALRTGMLSPVTIDSST